MAQRRARLTRATKAPHDQVWQRLAFSTFRLQSRTAAPVKPGSPVTRPTLQGSSRDPRDRFARLPASIHGAGRNASRRIGSIGMGAGNRIDDPGASPDNALARPARLARRSVPQGRLGGCIAGCAHVRSATQPDTVSVRDVAWCGVSHGSRQEDSETSADAPVESVAYDEDLMRRPHTRKFHVSLD